MKRKVIHKLTRIYIDEKKKRYPTHIYNQAICYALDTERLVWRWKNVTCKLCLEKLNKKI